MSGECEKCNEHCLDCKCDDVNFYAYTYLKDYVMLFVENYGHEDVIKSLKKFIRDLENDQ